MKRVASLYLPYWPIDRLRRAERRSAPSPEADAQAAYHALGAEAAAERLQHCSVPKEGGWRPGARWAKSDPGSGLADTREEVEAAIEALPQHRRPPQRELGRVSVAADNPFRGSEPKKGLSRPPEERVAPPPLLRELSRRTEAAEHPFRSMPSDEVGRRIADRVPMPSLQFPGEDAPAKANRGAALRAEAKRDRYRNEAPPVLSGVVGHGPLSIHRVAALPSVQFPGEDVATRRAQRSPRRSARDGHGGEAGYIAPPSLAQLAAMPAVQFPGEGPHPDNHGKSEPIAPTYGQGRFFQTGRTLGSVVARVCREEGALTDIGYLPPDEPPLVTTHKVGPRVEIAAANPAARSLGLTPGMALTMARAQVPGLEVRVADPEGDAADLRSLAELLARRWSPVVAVSDADGLFIDLTGVAHLHGGEARFARRLLRLLARHGVTARLAIADTAGAAWALARHGGGGAALIVKPGEHDAAIAPLPVTALRLEPASLELLARLGVDTAGQLLAMPRAPLVRRFGKAIVLRLDQATGRVPEPFDPVVPPTTVTVEQRFAEPIATAEAIEHWLRQLMPRLARALAEAGQGARSVELIAARVDGVPQRLRLGFARPTRDPAHMLRLALRRIEEIEPGFGIDAIALHVHRADPLGPESLAPALADPQVPDLAPLVDTLANRIGADRLWRASPVESDVPERSVALAPPLDPGPKRLAKAKRDDVRLLDSRAPDHPWHPRWPRPVRLLRRPEMVHHVMAELPDQPPRRFTWRGKAYRVVRADGPERIAGEWWRRPAERQAVRDYFQVEVESGQRFWLYRRGDGVRSETGDLSWFLHGRVD
ncbi:DNA polymerase Y family protein [Sphingomonas arenae]|uniref:DNA polymerase Y family protein n=1 Tax=Sphingomonas arenae TaxID=2812555 RepID=UPI001F319310|nr:DNA polymerase Y family protein [Sphingomonas arenae]